MARLNPGFSVTDLEDSDEEELLITLLARALEQSPKTTRGTSTIKEWMTIIDQSQDLKHALALNSSQQQNLETFAMANQDMELDIYQIKCIYSMILKSQPLQLEVDSLSSSPPPPPTNKSTKKQQHPFMQRMMDQSPSSPTPTVEQRSLLESSTPRLLEQLEDTSFRSQGKGKKVSIDPTLKRRGTANSKYPDLGSDNSDESSRHNSGDEGFTGQNNQRLQHVLYSHRQNSRLSFQPLDEQCNARSSNNNSINNGQQQEQQTGRNVSEARIKDMEKEIQALLLQIKHHKALEAHHLEQMEELKSRVEKTEQQHRQLDQQRSDELGELQGKIRDARSELEASQSDLLNANQRCSQLEDSLVKTQNDSLYWKSTLEQTRGDVARWKTSSERSQNDAAHWKAVLERMQNDATQWKTALDQKIDELALLQKDVDHHKVALYKLESEMDQKEEELKKSQKRTTELEKIIPPEMTLSKETLHKVARLEKEKEISDTVIASTKDKLIKLTKEYEASQDRIKELERQRPNGSSRPLSFWSQWEAITHDKKRLADQLDTQTKVIERLRSQIMSNGSMLVDQAPLMEKRSPRWWLPILGISGLLLMIVVSGFVYAINSPPPIYGLWNDPHGYQGQWLTDAPMPRSWILLMLDRLFLPRNHTFVPPI